MAPTSSIPEGYTFLNRNTMLAVKSKERLFALGKKADGRNPDAHDMYIYNDFFGYAIIDLVDRTLSTAHTKLTVTTKRDLDEAYCILEALAIFMDFESLWMTIDDGERVELTNKTFGVLVVSLLRQLHKGGRLNAAAFPSLEFFLRNVTRLGENMDADYADVARGVARNLFKDKTEADKELEKRRVEEWLKSLKDQKKDDDQAMDADEDDEGEDEDEDEDEDEKDKGKLWYMKKHASGLNDRNPELTLTTVWKEYRAYLAECPREPFRGPCWDIDDWTEEEKKPFLFSSMGDDMDD